jgi:4-alpha-glucanotransferase
VAAGPPPAAQTPKPAVDAAAAFVADAPGPLALIPLEDLLGLVEQINLPGPPGPHPNWRRRLPLTPEALFADPAVAPRLERLNKARPR